MICFRDMAFCDDKECINTTCLRHHSHTEDNIDFLPVCWGAFSLDCKEKKYEDCNKEEFDRKDF